MNYGMESLSRFGSFNGSSREIASRPLSSSPARTVPMILSRKTLSFGAHPLVTIS